MNKSFILLALCAGIAQAQVLPEPKYGIPLERFYKYPLITGRSPAGADMSPDGKHIVFGWNETGERKLDVWMMDFPSGQKRKLIEAAKIEALPRQDDSRTDLEKEEEKLYDGGIAGFTWSPDSKEVLFSYKGRVWLMTPDGKNLHPLFDSSEGISSPKYSPDGKYLSFIRRSNVFRYDRSTGLLKQLTFISKPNTNIDFYDWSPDSKNIAVTWEDTSKMGTHVMMDFSKDRATVVNIQRMWHGEKSTNVKVGLVPADGGLIKWVDGIPGYTWLAGVQFSPDGRFISIGAYKEDFQEFNIWVASVDNLKKFAAYKEKAPKNYLPDWRPHLWSKDGKWIYFGTDVIDGQFGFRSIMRIPALGGKPEKVFNEAYDVVGFTRPKDSDRLILVTMGRSPLKTEITILEPNGRRTVHVPMENGFATAKNFDDAAPPLVSDDGKHIASLCSDRTINPELYSIEPEIKRLTVSQTAEYQKVKMADAKEVTFKAPDGRDIHAVLITPPGVDSASHSHPAFISNMYANSAKLAWGGLFDNYAAMELGFVVLQVDFRASWGYGGEFNSGYYKSMGIVDADESVAARNYLASLPYVNPGKIGCWGWSYGGFLTCMNLLTKPGVFQAGVAVASVTDWKSYNEWYTRRRLGMESDDKEIYKKTSPIYQAAGLKDNLKLIHGILDDNVLFQDTERLIQRLIDNGKHFDVMTYPRDDHSIGKETSRPHVFVEIMRYLWEKLGR